MCVSKIVGCVPYCRQQRHVVILQCYWLELWNMGKWHAHVLHFISHCGGKSTKNTSFYYFTINWKIFEFWISVIKKIRKKSNLFISLCKKIKEKPPNSTHFWRENSILWILSQFIKKVPKFSKGCVIQIGNCCAKQNLSIADYGIITSPITRGCDGHQRHLQLRQPHHVQPQKRHRSLRGRPQGHHLGLHQRPQQRELRRLRGPRPHQTQLQVHVRPQDIFRTHPESRPGANPAVFPTPRKYG